jgi:hypothetical protein
MADWVTENGLMPPDDSYDEAAHDLEEAERAVIEAARACVHGWSEDASDGSAQWYPPFSQYAKDKLEAMVRILEEVER